MQATLEGTIMLKYEQELHRLIPPNFGLIHYAGTENLDAQGWLACLWHRLNTGNGYKLTQWTAPLDYQLPEELLNYELEDLASVSFLELDHIIKTKYKSKTYAYFGLDLDMCDDLLIEDFKTELKLARSKSGIAARTRKISESDFSNWHKAKILQYLDLRNWHKLKKLTPTNNQIGEILFPEDTEGEVGERIRRTVNKHFETVTSRKTIISLLAQTHKQRKQHEKIEKS